MPGRTLFIGLWSFIILAGLGTAAWFLLGPSGSSAAAQSRTGTAGFPAPVVSGSLPARVSTSASPDPAAVAAITRAYQRLFDPATPVATRERLVQDGPRFAAALRAYSRSAEGAHTVVSVDTVAVHGATADVTYTVYVNKVDELSRIHGGAVRSGGTWMVARASLCRVLAYENLTATPCSSAS